MPQDHEPLVLGQGWECAFASTIKQNTTSIFDQSSNQSIGCPPKEGKEKEDS